MSEIHECRHSTNDTNLARQQYFLERRMILLWNFTTRPCRSVLFRCYDEKYYFRYLIWFEILLLTLNKGFARSKNGASSNPCSCNISCYYVPLPHLVWNSVALPWTKWFARSKDGASFSPCSCNISCYYVPLPHLVWNSVALSWAKWFARSKDGLKAQ